MRFYSNNPANLVFSSISPIDSLKKLSPNEIITSDQTKREAVLSGPRSTVYVALSEYEL